MSSNGKLGKSVFCAFHTGRGMRERWMEYYVSDEKKFMEIEESYEEDKVKELLKIKGEDYFYGSYIVFKSCLYRIGGWNIHQFGCDVASKTVEKLDMKNMDSDCVWVKVGEMNCGRRSPCTVILGGKLYVVGGLEIEPEKETAILMEVLRDDESGWETIPNPPQPPPPPQPREWDKYMIHKMEISINYYYRLVYKDVIAGAVESETNALIIVIIPDEFENFDLYTYEEAKGKKWRPYTKLTSKHLTNKGLSDMSISRQPAVISGKLMLYLVEPEILYVMDMERGDVHTIDLVKRSVIDEDRIDKHSPPFLMIIENGKFCVIWAVVNPNNNNSGILKGCIFSLKRRTKKQTFRVNQKSRWSSLLPDLTTRSLQAVCLVD